MPPAFPQGHPRLPQSPAAHITANGESAPRGRGGTPSQLWPQGWGKGMEQDEIWGTAVHC